jgi:Family of unknown function (DUF6551)
MNKPTQANRRASLDTHLRWVPLDEIRFAEEGKGQRELKQSRVDKINGAGFDPELMGYPVASHRDEHYWILDGHARIDALKAWLGDWHGQQVQCRVFEGLTVEDEASIFLELNNFTQVSAFSKFKNAVTAGRDIETDINRIVVGHGLVVSRETTRDDSVSCVAALIRVYRRGGPLVFAQALRVARDAYGKPGFESAVIDGLGLLCTRYNGQLTETDAVKKLGAVRGGVNGLLGRAQTIRKATDAALNEAVAAAAVEIINSGRGNVKLKPWFKAAAQ